MSGRASPFHCPYCGDENLWPHQPTDAEGNPDGTGHGAWECRSCQRAFSVRFLGILRRTGSAS